MSYSRQRSINNKTLTLNWVHKIDDNNYKIINNTNDIDNEIEIYWVRYGLGVEADLINIDIVGVDWIYQDSELKVDK
jgi:outer membrane autotransporter protein